MRLSADTLKAALDPERYYREGDCYALECRHVEGGA